MKLRHVMALAGPLMLIASEHALGDPAISAVVNTTNSYLVASGLQSATIHVTGFNAGTSMQGFIGTTAQPWNITTGDGSAFFNIDTVTFPSSTWPPFADGFYAAPSNNAVLNQLSNNTAMWDSGLLGSLTAQPNSSDFGSPSDSDPEDNAGDFAWFALGGSNDVSIAPVAWISIAPLGLAVGPTSNLRVLRLTWSAYTSATVSFTLAMNTPAVEIPMSITIAAAPGPGTFGLLALAGALKSRRRVR